MFVKTRAQLRRLLVDFSKGVTTPLTCRLLGRPQAPEVPESLHLLLSAKTWDFGVLAALSFEHSTGRRWPIVVHEDGTITPDQRKTIEHFLECRFVTRAEADAVAEQRLANHPLSLDQRRSHVFMLKFFDLEPFAPKERFVYLDSDIIFYREAREVIDWQASGRHECWFNEDTRETYCSPREEIEAEMGVSLWRAVNAGFCLVTKRALSLDLTERLLTTFQGRARHPQFYEQTLWALNASHFGQGGLLPRTYEISWGLLKRPGCICRHYVGPPAKDILYIEGTHSLLAQALLKKLRLA
jgi:hypothetical protein